MQCQRLWGVGLALGSLLLAGCGSTPSARRPAPERPVPVAAPKAASAQEPSGQSLAQAHAHYAAGVIHEMNDEPAAALQEYYQAALKDPDNESLILEVTRRLLQDKQPDKALELLTRAVARPNASGALYARLGLVYTQLGKFDQAVTADRAAIKRSPEALAGYHNLFLNYLQNKQEQQALNVLDEAARQPSKDPEFFISLSELYANLGLQMPAQRQRVGVKALAALDQAEKLKPTAPSARIKLADGYSLLGEWKKAAQLYLELLKSLPEVPLVRERIHAKLAEIYLRGSDRKRASEQLQAVVKEDPTNPMAYYYLGSLAYDANKPAEAVENFNKTLLLSPEFEQAYYDLALAQIGLSQPGDALATLEKARKRFPQNFVMEFWTGLAYSRQKAYAQALQHFTAAEVIAKATDPKRLNQLYYFEVGSTCERAGKLEEAEKNFQKCLEIAPDFAEAQNYLGYMWAEHGIKLPQARQLIEKAVKSEPKNPAYLDSLAWVLFKLNQPQEALTYVLKAVELAREPDPTLYDHLGDIYAAVHDLSKARAAWTKSLALEPNEQVRQKLGTVADKPKP